MTYRPTIRDYQEAVAHAFGITVAELVPETRTRRHCVPRHVLCALLYEVPGMSTLRIGEAIGRDHTNVLNALKRFPYYMSDPIYRPKIERAREELGRGGIFRTRRK